MTTSRLLPSPALLMIVAAALVVFGQAAIFSPFLAGGAALIFRHEHNREGFWVATAGALVVAVWVVLLYSPSF
jgi:hypothetical protein